MRCKVCKVKFTPVRFLQKVCSPECGLEFAKKTRELISRKELREGREKLKTRGEYAQEAQKAFNAYVRYRDSSKGFGCISCGTKTGKANAGHFKSVGGHPELRFNLHNCHLQCERCNTYLHGNLLKYRENLIDRIGESKVDCLEGKTLSKNYSIPDLIRIKTIFIKKLKLSKARNDKL